MASNNRNIHRNALFARSVEERASIVKEELDKISISESRCPASKVRVGCYHCILNSFSKTYTLLAIRKDRLGKHYKTHHPGETKQQWDFFPEDSEATAKKQARISSFSLDGSSSSVDPPNFDDEV